MIEEHAEIFPSRAGGAVSGYHIPPNGTTSPKPRPSVWFWKNRPTFLSRCAIMPDQIPFLHSINPPGAAGWFSQQLARPSELWKALGSHKTHSHIVRCVVLVKERTSRKPVLRPVGGYCGAILSLLADVSIPFAVRSARQTSPPVWLQHGNFTVPPTNQPNAA